MEYQEGKAILSQVRVIESMIRQKLLLAEALRASLMPRAIQYDTDKVQASQCDPIPEVMVKIETLNEEVDALALEKQKAILDVARLIDSLSSEKESEILTAFYISGKPVTWIMKEMHYSRSGVYRIMRKGIEKIESV